FFNINIQKDNEPKQAIKKILRQAIHTIETNSLIRQMYFENNMEAILRKLPREKLDEHFNSDSDTLNTLIEKWKKEGVLLNKNPDVIAGILRSLFVLTLHQEGIGESVYRETIEWYIDLIVNALVSEGN